MLGSALFHHQEGPKPMPPASLTLRVLLMSGCADFQQGTWHYGEHQPLHLLRNNGDSWKEGSESITRIAKGCIPYGLEERPGCLIAGETRRMQRPPERSSGYLLRHLCPWVLLSCRVGTGAPAVGAGQPHLAPVLRY